MNSCRKKILFIADNWARSDGRAKVVFNILTHLNKDSYDLILLIIRPQITSAGQNNFNFPYPTGIKIQLIEKDRFRKLIIPLTQFLIREQPHIIVTSVLFLMIPIVTIANILSLLCRIRNRSRIIIIDHVFLIFGTFFLNRIK
ncbi:MAG: hypothetical protein ACKKMV_00175 [Candidatus Nealsonbacteria bacterium]